MVTLRSTRRKTYQYSALSSEIREIRLVEILPISDIIDIRLHKYTLDAAPPFEALTYTLEAFQDTEKLIPIRCGGLPFDLRIEICTFLQLQRNKRIANSQARCPLIWVDAICINLEDWEETKHSRSFMNAVYAKATRTIGWLGFAPIYDLSSLETTMNTVVDSMRDFVSFSDPDPAQLGVKVTQQLIHTFREATKNIPVHIWRTIDKLLELRFFTR
jgi:hypothetical protein